MREEKNHRENQKMFGTGRKQPVGRGSKGGSIASTEAAGKV